jgi:pimeloyl-ACP methyl ester carboxylesterase
VIGVRDLRILCLHGYHGSAAVLRTQMARFVAAMPTSVEFVYVDAPSLAAGDYGWWHAGSGGWERTRTWATQLFRSTGGFDGVFGFSQGAALTGLLAGVQETRTGDPHGEINFDFALMVGGFKSDAAEPDDLFIHRLTVPSAHVIGRIDGVVPPAESRRLADQFTEPLVLEHVGGHVVPGDSAVTRPIVEFLERLSGAEPSPPVRGLSGAGR